MTSVNYSVNAYQFAPFWFYSICVKQASRNICSGHTSAPLISLSE